MSGFLEQPSSAAGPYGVRGSDPNRLRGLKNPADKTGFSGPVYLTVCPYLARRPARTLPGLIRQPIFTHCELWLVGFALDFADLGT